MNMSRFFLYYHRCCCCCDSLFLFSRLCRILPSEIKQI